MPTPLTSPAFPDYDGPEGDVLRCLVAYTPHGGYCVPRGAIHRPCAQAILRGESFEPETVAFLRRHAGRGDVVHAGTFFGDMLPPLSRACGTGGIVWAGEPNPESRRCAEVTIALNGLANVRLVQAAFGRAEGSGLLRVTDRTGTPLGGKSELVASLEAGSGERGERVRVVRIDDFVPGDRHVAVIHLDVERHEQEALAGALDTIRRCLPPLVLETVPEPAWLEAHLAPLGYAPAGRVGPNALFAVD